MARATVSPMILFYSPIGLLFVIIRSLLLIYVFLASVILYSLPPIKRIVLRIMCSVLGFVVTYEGIPLGKPDQPYVSNCVTLFDHMGLNLLTTCVTPYKFMMSWALSWRKLNCEENETRSKIDEVFHLQPEEFPMGTHNKTLLKFNVSPFKLFTKVQPVVISVRNILDINMSIHPIDWKSEIFWTLFSPIIHVHFKFLSPIKIGTDDSYVALADLCRQSIGDELHYSLNDLDKHQFSTDDKKSDQTCEQSINANVTNKYNNKSSLYTFKLHRVDNADEDNRLSKINTSTNNQDSMESSENYNLSDPRIVQILAVLPDAKPADIYKYLVNYDGDVDTVIAEILENNCSTVSINQKQNKISSETRRQLVTQYLAPSSHKVAADSFSRVPTSRHQSLQERKNEFLDNARRRYLELHPTIINY